MSLKKAIPVLASLDREATQKFYEQRLKFKTAVVNPLIVQRDGIEIVFWDCENSYLAENTSCRVLVDNIEVLYSEYCQSEVIHPNAPLQEKPWGAKEFGILDNNGNLIVFTEPIP